MLIISRPSEIRWYAAAICAASTGLITPGRNATRNFSRDVSRSSAAVVSQASSQNVPVGVRHALEPDLLGGARHVGQVVDGRLPEAVRQRLLESAAHLPGHALAGADQRPAVAGGRQEPVQLQTHVTSPSRAR